MIETKIVTKVENTQAVGAQKNLRKEINALRKELDTLDKGTDEYKKTFDELAVKMKTLQDRTRALRESSGDLGDLIANTGKTITGLSGGFSAATSAMVLFGSESAELEKALLKIQAAANFASGIAQLEDIMKSIPALKNNIKGMFGNTAKDTKEAASSMADLDKNTIAAAGSAGEMVTELGQMKSTQEAINTIQAESTAAAQKNIQQRVDYNRYLEEEIAILEKKEVLTKLEEADLEQGKKFKEENAEALKEEIKSLQDKTKATDESGKASVQAGKDSVKASKGAIAGIKATGTAMIKSLAIMAAITVAITGLVWLFDKLKEAAEKANRTQKLLNETLQEGVKGFAESSSKLDVLVAEFRKLNTEAQKTEYLKKYGKELKTVGIHAKDVAELEKALSSDKQVAMYRNALVEKANAQAAFNKTVELTSKILEIQLQQEVLANTKLLSVWEDGWIRLKNLFNNDKDLINEKGDWDPTLKKRADLQKEIDALQKDKEFLAKSFNIAEIFAEDTKEVVKAGDELKVSVIKTLQDLINTQIAFFNKTKKSRSEAIQYEIDMETYRWETLKAMNITEYDILLETGENYFDKIKELKQQKILEDKLFAEESINISHAALLDELNNNIEEVEASKLTQKEKTDLIEKYNAKIIEVTESYNTDMENIQFKYNKEIADSELENYKSRLESTVDYYDKLLKQVDYNNKKILNKIDADFSKYKANLLSSKSGSFLEFLGLGKDTMKEDLAELDYNIERFKGLLKDTEEKESLLNRELSAEQTTASRRMEIEYELSNIQKEQEEYRTSITESEAAKRNLINENTMKKIEAGFETTSMVFQSVVDLNEASFEETQTNLKKQLESGKITKEQYDKDILKAQQDVNEKNKKWQAGIAMVDGISGSIKAFTGAMSLGPIAGPIVGSIQAAAILASTVASIKKIYAQKVSDSGSGGSINSTGAGSILAPLNYTTNVTTDSQETKINEPMKVYVTEYDIKKTSSKVNVTDKESTF